MVHDRVTQTDIAARAGVSVGVVSRVLSGRGDVSQQTRARVMRIARELGYVRGAEPRGRPASSPGNVVELALDGFDGSWGLEVVAGASRAAAKRGLDLVLVAERDEPGDDWAERVRDRRSLGVVTGIMTPTRQQLEMLRDTAIPLVVLDPRTDPPLSVPTVAAANREGGAEAARHLLELGHRDLLVVTGAPAYRFGRERARGFIAEIERTDGCLVDSLAVGWSAAEARDGVLPAMRERAASGRPLGVFCTSDLFAAGVMRAAGAAGLSIPRDVSVVGFDDMPAFRRLSPALTTVRQPIREMAGAAVELLAEMIDARTLDLPGREIATELLVRRSTAAPGRDVSREGSRQS